ncbi:MAG: family 65 glycosyl hydrolase, partial [Firmicutes bacterium]|nr:family 65 glycosyl hydrolase [Bacillota bacterium]
PRAAKTLLAYRYRTLPQAMERAAELGLQGACYPIATLDGTEGCTLWQHSSLQMQPSTSVAYAIDKYADVTGDTASLLSEGAEMLVQIARYLYSRGDWNGQGFGFYGVMGPDEFHMMVSNDFYTNFMGRKALLLAANVVASMPEAMRAQLVQKTGVEDKEIEAWRRAADRMIFLRREDGVLEQHEGYFNLPHIDVHQIPQEEFPLYSHWSYDRIYRTDMIKQPDVLMAMLLYGDDFTPEEKAANYAYYEPRCVHESSLSPSIHAILAAELGLRDDTLRFFAFATRLDLDNYNRNTSEGLHLSSVAATWRTIVQGFGGARYENGQLSLRPWLPEQWRRFSFSLQIRASILRVEVSANVVSLACEGEPFPVLLYGREIIPQAQRIGYPLEETCDA